MAKDDVDLQELKEAVEELQSSWGEFKSANDERLQEIEKKGSADVLTEEKVKRIDKSIEQVEELNQKVTKAQEEAKVIAEKKEEERKELTEKLEKAGARLEVIEAALQRAPFGGGDPDEAEEKKKTKEARKRFMNYCVLGEDEMERDDLKALKEYKKLTLGDDAAAGFLAPSEYVREIIKAETVFSPIRSIARIRSITGKEIQIPRRTGQFSAQWTSESGTRSETTGLTYGLETLPTHEMYALVDISQTLLEDSAFNLESELEMEFSEQFGVLEGAGFVTGTGSGQPEGFMNNDDVGENNSGSAATIADTDGQADGLITLQHALKEAYARNATWVLKRTTIGSVRKLKDANDNYIWQPGNLATGNPNTILGDPYVEVTDMPAEAAGAYPIAYGDWRRAYTIVDRIAMSVLRDPYTQATSGAIRYIARRRVGGQVVLAEAIRKLKCSA